MARWLRPGEGEGQLVKKGLQIGFAADIGGLGVGVVPHRAQRQRQPQKLLEDQPPAGNLGALPVGGQVDVAQGKLQVAEVILLPDKVGDGVVQLLAQQLQRLCDVGADHLGGKPLGQRVDRNQGVGQVGGIDGGEAISRRVRVPPERP